MCQNPVLEGHHTIKISKKAWMALEREGGGGKGFKGTVHSSNIWAESLGNGSLMTVL